MRDDSYWTSRKNSLELIEISSINKTSLYYTFFRMVLSLVFIFFKADVPSDGSRLVLRGKCENNEANNRERYIFTWLPSKNLPFAPYSRFSTDKDMI
jgi:hypothetical protein